MQAAPAALAAAAAPSAAAAAPTAAKPADIRRLPQPASTADLSAVAAAMAAAEAAGEASSRFDAQPRPAHLEPDAPPSVAAAAPEVATPAPVARPQQLQRAAQGSGALLDAMRPSGALADFLALAREAVAGEASALDAQLAALDQVWVAGTSQIVRSWSATGAWVVGKCNYIVHDLMYACSRCLLQSCPAWHCCRPHSLAASVVAQLPL